MISVDQFLHCDVRLRQAKINPEQSFGGLGMNICGDFMQLPPVDKDGSRRSLAMPLDDHGQEEVDVEEGKEMSKNQTTQSRKVESRQGRELWLSIRRVVSLTVNVRAPDVLSRLLAEMRSEHRLSDAMWDLYIVSRSAASGSSLVGCTFFNQ